MNLSFSFLLLFLICLQLLLLINGGKYDYTKTSDSLFAHFLVQDFGIADNGILKINYSSKQVNTTTNFSPNSSILKLVILDSTQRGSWYKSLVYAHTTDASDVRLSCQQPSLFSRNIKINSEEEISFVVGRNFSTANQFSVLLMQCKYLSEDNQVEITVDVETKNIKPDSFIAPPSTSSISTDENYTYLSIEETPFLHFFPFEISVYALLILGILFQIYLTQ